MRIQKINANVQSNRKTNQNPNFTGIKMIDLRGLSIEDSFVFVSAFKSEMGQGLKYKQYSSNGKNFAQECFIGYNRPGGSVVSDIIYSTGDDTQLGGRLVDKIKQVDDVISGQINNVFSKLKGVIDTSPVTIIECKGEGISGKINLFHSAVDVIVESDLIDKLNISSVKRIGHSYLSESHNGQALKYSYSQVGAGRYNFDAVSEADSLSTYADSFSIDS